MPKYLREEPIYLAYKILASRDEKHDPIIKDGIREQLLNPNSIDDKIIINDRDIINLKVAYACKIGDPTSVIYKRLINKLYFDYRIDTNIAREIVNFKSEVYLLECNQGGKKFKIKLIYEMKNGKLKYHQKYCNIRLKKKKALENNHPVPFILLKNMR